MAQVWIVEDHRATLHAMTEIARGAGHDVTAFESAESVFAALATAVPDVVITDLRLPRADGHEVLRAVRAANSSASIIVVTAHGSIEDAVRAVRAGALDFVTKPLSANRLEVVLRNASERVELVGALDRARRENARVASDASADLVWRSASMNAVLDQVRRAAASDATVLLLGESGTGKERLARRLHDLSPRRAGPFVPTHLAALSEGLLESELFGHERGAFTGAQERHVGRFEEASKGTLFLDEVAEIDPRTQVKLLRVLQERVVERVGGRGAIPVDVRVVAATHRDLDAAVRDGAFREDLLWRLDVVRIVVPPLRERPGDVPVLLATFLDRFASRYGRAVPELPPDVLGVLLRWHWPGNVRELENVTERLVVMGSDTVSVDDLPARLLRPASPHTPGLPTGDIDLTPYLEDIERTLLLRALARSPDNKAQAARSLGLSREALRYKLQKYGLDT